MRLLVTILTTTILLSCSRQRDQVEAFVFDNKRITTRTTHSYEFYSDGKIKIDNSTTFYSLAGVPFDSVSRHEYFTYSPSGNLLSKFNPTDSTRRIYVYNEVDSLIGDFSINEFGDTSVLATTDYRHEKIIKKTHRMLRTKFLDDIESMAGKDFRKYDTMLYVSELIYSGDKLQMTVSKDKAGEIISEVHEFYEGDRPVKSMTYSFLGDVKYVSEIKEYTDNDLGKPDYLATGPQGDTIGYRKTILQDNVRIIVYYYSMGGFSSQSISYYDERGLLIGSVDTDLKQGTRDIYSYMYDDKGHTIEESNYKESLSNAR